MAIVGEIKVNIKPVEAILKRQGLDVTGDVQQFHTANVLRRIVEYMPYRSGATIKIMKIQSPVSRPYIHLAVPYARYLHEGKVMVNAKTGKGPMYIPNIGYRYRKGTQLRATTRPLTYTTTKNQEAGPKWGERLMAAKGDAMLNDLKKYVQGRE